MKRRLLIGGVLFAIVIIAIAVYTVRQRAIARSSMDVTDRDFIATISSTSTPSVVNIDVRKVNPKAQKQIKGWIAVNFVLEDSNGHVYQCRYIDESDCVRQVRLSGSAFDINRGPASDVSGKVRIVTKGLKAGTYKVTPVVRIVEIGKDALHGPYLDSGSVAVPARNSINVEVK